MFLKGLIMTLFAIYFGIGQTSAQNNKPTWGSIKGNVYDKESQNPLFAATIVLMAGEKTAVSGAVTSEDGGFELQKVQFGKYRIKVTFMGYKSYKDSVEITPKRPKIDLGEIFLKPESESLKPVEIVETKDDFVNDIDKKVYLVENNILSYGGTAIDALRTIPAVNVEINGKISLRGSRGVTVLIDGKQSGLSGSSRQAVLDNLPAANIERIEVITNPGAKYDADGNAGIINIVLKKNGNLGTTAFISASAGTRDKYNATGYFGYNTTKVNFYLSYNFRYTNYFGFGNSSKEVNATEPVFFLNQDRQSLDYKGSHMARTGLTYNFNPKTSVSVSGVAKIGHQIQNKYTLQNRLDQNQSRTLAFERNAVEGNTGISYDVDMSFRKAFSNKKHRILVNAGYSRNDDNERTEMNTQFYDAYLNPANTTPELRIINGVPRFGLFSGKIDYELPVGKKMLLEIGAKANIRHSDNDFAANDYNYSTGAWENNTNFTNHFLYNEQVYASYISLEQKVKLFSYKVGFRFEEAIITTNQLTLGLRNQNKWFNVYPSVHLGYKISETGDLRLSYTRRVNRPSVKSLNPFPDLTNPLSISLGNPNLNPEYTHSAELSYAFKNSKHSVVPSIYYKYTTGVMGKFNTLGTDGIANITYQNLNDAQAGGVEVVAKNKLAQWWDLTSSVNVYYYKLNAANVQSDLNNSALGGLVKVLSMFRFWDNMMIQVSGNVVLPQITAQNTTLTRAFLDIAVRKDFFRNKVSLTLACSDVFNTNQAWTNTRGLGFTTEAYRKKESRILILTVAYKFGKKSNSKQLKKEEEELMDDMMNNDDD